MRRKNISRRKNNIRIKKTMRRKTNIRKKNTMRKNKNMIMIGGTPKYVPGEYEDMDSDDKNFVKELECVQTFRRTSYGRVTALTTVLDTMTVTIKEIVDGPPPNAVKAAAARGAVEPALTNEHNHKVQVLIHGVGPYEAPKSHSFCIYKSYSDLQQLDEGLKGLVGKPQLPIFPILNRNRDKYILKLNTYMVTVVMLVRSLNISGIGKDTDAFGILKKFIANVDFNQPHQ